MSVFRNLDCLSLVVCSNATLLKLQNVLFLLFSKFCALKSGVRLIYGCGFYTDVYGKFPSSSEWLLVTRPGLKRKHNLFQKAQLRSGL